MAELLIRAKPHWMDSLTEKDIEKFNSDQRESYDARSQKGDIIVVRPDGWEWGREECPPKYVVVKLKNVTVDDVKHYTEPLVKEIEVDNEKRTVYIKRHKYAVDIAIVDDCSLESKGQKEIGNATFNTKLIIKEEDGKSTEKDY